MKKTTFLLLSLLWEITCLHAQDTTRRVDVHFRHATLQQAFAVLEKQFGLNFSYNESNIRLYSKEINFALKDATARQVLDRIFTGSALTWSLKGSLVVLFADPNYIKKQSAGHASTETLSGNLSDAETGEPVEGATVKVGDRTVVTGEDGRYKLSIPAGTYTVSATHIVYGTLEVKELEVPANSQTVLNLSLKKNGSALNEVVVVGYGKQSRKLLSSSISTVQNSEFNQGNFNNPGQLLQGKVAGLTITRSGDPNGTPTITLRGP